MRPNSIPPLLAPYLHPSRADSLTLLTSVLGASTNWLLLRYLATLISPSPPPPSSSPTGVILLSFLRDYDFWRSSARKLGLDLAHLAAQNRLIVIDGLSGLFSSGNNSGGAAPRVQGDHVVLRDPGIDSVERNVVDLLKRANQAAEKGAGAEGEAGGARTLLLVDGLDFLMAANELRATLVLDAVMAWREIAHKVVVTLAADSPLIHDTITPMEDEHLRLAIRLGHQAEVIMGLRLLDTGTARDVSGVLRISRGADAEPEVEENEFLYFVGGDGNVKVFSRGASV